MKKFFRKPTRFSDFPRIIKPTAATTTTATARYVTGMVMEGALRAPGLMADIVQVNKTQNYA